MNRFPALITAAAMLTGCFSPSPRNADEALAAAIDSVCTEYFPAGEPGAAVLVLRGDEIIFDKGYGTADLGTGAAVDGDTFFNIASVSKQFTTVAVLQLAERGLLDLDAPVSQYFPELRSDIWNKVKVKHLMSHSSGVPDGRGYLTREQKIAGDEALATEYLYTLDELHFEPGTAYEYINPTFVLLGMLVEKVSGVEFTEYVSRNIFRPAGMAKSLYFDRDRQELIPNMAHGYEYADVTGMPEERTAGSTEGAHDWYEYDFGEETFFATRSDGGIYTSTHEFVQWEKALRNGTLLKPETLALAFTPHTDVSGSPWSDYQNRPGTWYGYGWFIEPENNVIYHTGDNGGFKILACRYPGKDLLVLVFANRADWDRYALKTSLEDILGSRN